MCVTFSFNLEHSTLVPLFYFHLFGVEQMLLCLFLPSSSEWWCIGRHLQVANHKWKSRDVLKIWSKRWRLLSGGNVKNKRNVNFCESWLHTVAWLWWMVWRIIYMPCNVPSVLFFFTVILRCNSLCCTFFFLIRLEYIEPHNWNCRFPAMQVGALCRTEIWSTACEHFNLVFYYDWLIQRQKKSSSLCFFLPSERNVRP